MFHRNDKFTYENEMVLPIITVMLFKNHELELKTKIMIMTIASGKYNEAKTDEETDTVLKPGG